MFKSTFRKWGDFFSNKEKASLFFALFIFLPLPMCYILYFGIVPTWHTILFPFISLILYTVKDIGLFFVFMMLFLDILQSFILLYLLRLISSIFVFLSNKCFKKYSPIFIGVIIMALIITVFTFRVYSSVAGENSIIHSNFFDVLKGYKDIILMHFFFK